MTPVEKQAYERVLAAARDGKLSNCVVRTRHVLGKAGPSVAECTCASGAAEAALATRLIRGLGLVGVIFDGALRAKHAVDTETRYRTGEITNKERVKDHSRNGAGMIGGWAGAIAGAGICGTGGAEIGTAICPGLGTAIGGAGGVIIGGIGGYFLGDAVAGGAAEQVADISIGSSANYVMCDKHWKPITEEENPAEAAENADALRLVNSVIAEEVAVQIADK
jgi:hypothetical protein